MENIYIHSVTGEVTSLTPTEWVTLFEMAYAAYTAAGAQSTSAEARIIEKLEEVQRKRC